MSDDNYGWLDNYSSDQREASEPSTALPEPPPIPAHTDSSDLIAAGPPSAVAPFETPEREPVPPVPQPPPLPKPPLGSSPAPAPPWVQSTAPMPPPNLPPAPRPSPPPPKGTSLPRASSGASVPPPPGPAANRYTVPPKAPKTIIQKIAIGVGVAVAVGLSLAGARYLGSGTNASNLDVGDCFESVGEGDFFRVTNQDCAAAHDTQIFAKLLGVDPIGVRCESELLELPLAWLERLPADTLVTGFEILGRGGRAESTLCAVESPSGRIIGSARD